MAKMTTFTTRNQSRKKYYKLLLAGVLIVLLVAAIYLSRNYPSQKNDKKGQRSKSASSSRGSDPASTDYGGDQSKNRQAFYDPTSIIDETTVKIIKNGGPVRGQVRRTSGGKLVASFLGVPYASPPIGARRFESPQHTKPWTDTVQAFYQPSKCPQSSYISSITELKLNMNSASEDCLYLNIWAPHNSNMSANKVPHRASKPVLVFLHSGLFHFGAIGSEKLDPSNLSASKEIVVVTVQYRLGVLGFGTPETDANKDRFQSLGLQDQVKALQWIKQNIKAFGGNPDQITLSGHGAGAVSIGIHLMNPYVNQLFHRVILQGVHNIWNIGLYGVNSKSVEFMMFDNGCDKTKRQELKKCTQMIKNKANVLMETQQYQIDMFPIPFEPEFNPFTKELEKMMANSTSDQLMSLDSVFHKWNIFAPHIEIMIGLNSDDDYEMERINKDNRGISFEEDENEEEGEEEEEEEDEGEEENRENEEDGEVENIKTETSNDEIKEKDNLTSETKEMSEGNSVEEGSEKEMIMTTMSSSAGDESVTTETASMSNDTESEVEIQTEPSVMSTTIPTPTTVNSLVQRRRKRHAGRYRRQTESSVSINLDSDEKVKLCRLVNMYHIQRRRDKSSVSSKVFFYRVEPKVLLNPLEEVSFAFGIGNNWLDKFSNHLTNLWASFARSGNLEMLSSELAQYDSRLNSKESSDLVELVNIGQSVDSEKMSEIKSVQIKWKELCGE